MAGENEMRIIFGADTTPLRTEVSKATSTVDKFADGVEKTADRANKGFTELAKVAKIVPQAFNKAASSSIVLDQIGDNIQKAAAAASSGSKALEQFGTAPLGELKLLVDQLDTLRDRLSIKLRGDISFGEFKQVESEIKGIDSLRAAITQLGSQSASTAQVANALVAVFRQGFTQGVTEELQRAGVSVAAFKDALASLTGTGGANLTPLLQALDSIQAESSGTTTAIKSIGSALQGVSVLAKAPINDLVALDQELKVIKATLASGFQPSIEKINLQPGDFQGIQNDINQANNAVENFGQTVKTTVSGAIQSVESLKDAANTIPAAFDKAEQSATGLNKIGATIESAGEAAANGAKAFKQFGRLPLDDLKNFDKQLRTIRNTLASGFKPAVDAIKLIPVNFSKATQAVDQFGKAARKAKTETGAANIALNDISRIAQDLPFGFLGISNNINPMVESFARLKKETGSTGGALKALAGSLTGAGGLGLAIGVVTAAFTIYQNGILGFNRKTKDAQDAFEEFKKSLRDSEAITSDATGSVQGEIVRVQALAGIVGDLNKSTTERKRALTELQGINKSYFGDLTLEAAALGKVKSATDEYTNALIAQAVVKGFSDEISKMSTEMFKQEGILKKLAANYVKLNTQLEQVKEDKAIGPGAPAAAALANGVENASDALNKQIAIVGDLRNKFSDLKGEMGKAVLAANQFKSLDVGGGDKKKEDARLKALNLQLDELKGKLEKINKLREAGVLPKFKEDDAENLAKKILDVLQQIDAREVEIKLKPKLEIDPELNELEIDKIEAEANKKLAFTKMQAPLSLVIDTKGVISQAQGAANEALKKVGITERINPAEVINVDPKAFDPTIQKFVDAGKKAGDSFSDGLKEKLGQKIGDILSEAISAGFVQLGESLASVFTGGGFATAAEGFLGLIGSVLQEVGKQIIVASALVKALKESLVSLFAAPEAVLGVGIALVALGGILKNIKLDKPQKFAEGGIVRGPTMGLLGEAGPEMVIPLNRANQFIDNAGGNGFVAETAIRGRDLITIIRREIAAQSKLGGLNFG